MPILVLSEEFRKINTNSSPQNQTDLTEPAFFVTDSAIKNFMATYRRLCPEESVFPKLHYTEEHIVEFVKERWSWAAWGTWRREHTPPLSSTC